MPNVSLYLLSSFQTYHFISKIVVLSLDKTIWLKLNFLSSHTPAVPELYLPVGWLRNPMLLVFGVPGASTQTTRTQR